MADLYIMGIDLGSATSKALVLKNGTKVTGSAIVSLGVGTIGPQKAFEACLADARIKREELSMVVATGRGCSRFEQADLAINELMAHATGVHTMYPDARILIDIGGRDIKVMSIGERGRLDNFLMNDKCAAGTGRYLEVMAKVLGIDVSELKDYDEKAKGIIPISATCTVYAESEVADKLAEGVDIPSLVRGINTAVAVKAAALIRKLEVSGPVYVAGGVAQNTGVIRALAAELGTPVTASVIQQLNGAYGAALYGFERKSRGQFSGNPAR